MKVSKISWLILLIFLVLIIIPGSARAWTVDGYEYATRDRLNITGATKTDYRYMFFLNLTGLYDEGKLRADCGDLRFKNSSGTLLNYTIENCTTSGPYNSTIWIRNPNLPDIPYMYYGNSSATSGSNGTNTFYGWIDNTSTSGWSLGGTGFTIATEGEFLHAYDNNNADGRAYRTDWTSPNEWELHYRYKIADTTEEDGEVVGSYSIDGSPDHRFVFVLAPHNYEDQTKANYLIDPTTYTLCTGCIADDNSTERTFVQRVNESDSSTGVDFYIFYSNRTQIASATGKGFSYGSPTDMDGIYIGGGTGSATSGTDSYWRWMFLTDWQDGAITYELLGEECPPSGIPVITIEDPDNITFYNISVPFNFTATDDTLSTFPCWYLIDGTPTSIGNLTNNTYYSTTLSLNGAHYNLTVHCEDPGVGQNGSASEYFHVFSGFNVSVYDNDTNASMTDWTICFENSTNQDCSTDQNNSVLFEWDTIPYGSINITVSDGLTTLYYFNSTYARTNNESNYENLSAYIEPKDANILTFTASPGWNIAGETDTTVTCTSAEGAIILYRDGVIISSPYTATLAFGTYNFTCTIGETTNYAPASTTNWLNVLSGGFGCTDNETFAFELNLTITPGTNQTVLNFTNLVNSYFVRSDLNDVLPITNNNPRGWRNTTGYYYIVNVTGLTNLTVRFGNAISNYNWTTEGDTTGITNFTYSEINPYIRLTFVDERSGNVQLPPNSNRTLSVFCTGGISSYNISEMRMLVATTEQADEVRTQIQYSVTEIYYRNYIIDTDVENINAYLVDANIDQVVEMQILLQDATGDFDNSLLKAKKYVEGNLWTMTEHYFDAEGKVIIYLINGDKYSIYVDNGEEERSIGDLYIDTVDLTKTLTLGEILTTNQTLGNNTFGLYNTSDTIVFSYIDYSGLTISAEMWVLNWTNTSQQFYYTNSTNRSRIQFTYQVPDVNQTYLVHVVVHHETFGENSLDLWMAIFEAARSIPHPLQPLSSMFGDIEGITWQNLVGVFAVIGAAMLFTATSGGIAGSFAVITGAVLFMFGWWGANIAILAVAFVLSILNKLTEKRRES